MPAVLWIWDICHLELVAVLVQKEPIRAAVWDPSGPRVVLCTGTRHVYMWGLRGACSVTVPLSNFLVSDLRWSPDGSCLHLRDRDSFCCAALPSMELGPSDDSSDGDG
ncbi:unnamed protein product [Spirodela intermedia]|nr:unnamed protein product [Spirodela intermedia]CAA6666969.1 unnamed protein product [Spirodela intermedia]